MSLSVLSWPLTVECACCGYLMRAEPRAHLAREVVIACEHSNCEQYEKRLILRAQILDCEEAV